MGAPLQFLQMLEVTQFQLVARFENARFLAGLQAAEARVAGANIYGYKMKKSLVTAL
ncbi:MAG: hypothetical protein WA715_03810 [Candidatus Acidiferrum sp.]|jgi:hypothetical protein